MESELFVEAVAVQLCLPSVVCKGRVGEVVREKGGVVSRVDPFGDVVQAAQLPGDGFRRRHDRLKMLITRLCEWAGVGVECEVFGLFAHLIPQAELQRGLPRGRKRQGLVPDFRLKFQRGRESGAGAGASSRGSESVLAELKVLSCCKTRYPQGNLAKAVDRRAEQLPGEYLKKAKDVGQRFCGAAVGQQGPVEEKLVGMGNLRGLVFGAFGEASKDVHDLVQRLADSRVARKGLSRGRVCAKGEKSVVVGQLRRALSVATVKAQAESLVGKLEWVGEGAAAAAERRKRQWERSRLEREAVGWKLGEMGKGRGWQWGRAAYSAA